MAGEPYRFIGLGEDSERDVTLGMLRDRIELAIRGGVPLDTPVIEGYSPEFLAHCLYLKKPVDVTRMKFRELRGLALRNNPEDSTRGWGEIERRIEAFGLAGED